MAPTPALDSEHEQARQAGGAGQDALARRGTGAVIAIALALAGCPDAIPNPGTTSSSSDGSGTTGGGGSSGTTGGSGSSGTTGGGGGTGTPVLKGEFVGGAMLGEAGGVKLRGQIVWHAKVSGENNGIKLEGWLR